MSDLHWTEILRRTLFVAMAVVVATVAVVSPSRGAETPEPEEYIFRVLMPPQWTITDAIFAYQFKGRYYLPIVELADAYEFYIEAESARAYATGFAGGEQDTFTIDGERGELVIKGERQVLPPDAILKSDQIPDDDIYVDLEVLNKIWPVNMRIDLPSITIYVEPEDEKDLPFIKRKRREDRRSIFEAQKELKAEQGEMYPYVENGYQWFGKPVLDIQSSYTYNNRLKRLTGTNNISGTQQIAQFLADYSAAYSYSDGALHRPNSLRLRFKRQAVGDDNLLIPTLKHVEFGDISLSKRDLIGNSTGGRGVVFSNSPSSNSQEFDRITVEGTGPPGWDLELYNNNELLRFGKIEDNGEYRFEDVVLNYGNNRIRVIMYGPQGQQREVVEEHSVAGGLLGPGEFRYKGGIVDNGRPFIPLADTTSNTLPHLTRNLEASYGLNRWLTLFGSYTKTPYREKYAKYVTLGAAVDTPLGLAQSELYRRVNGGTALDTRLVTKLLGLRLNMRTAVYHNFESPHAGFDTGAKKLEAEVQANTTLNLPFMPLGLRFNVNHEELSNGTVTTTLTTGQSFTGGGLRFGHGTTSRFVGEKHQTTTGDFNVNWNVGHWQTRGALNYSYYPAAQLRSGTVAVRYNTRDSFQAGFNGGYDFVNSKSNFGTQIGYDFSDILTTLDTQYSENNGWQFTLRASTSINPYNADRSFKLNSDSRRNMAPVLGHVFLDRDGDGKFSEGDEPIKDAQLQIGRSYSPERTDENGYVVASLRQNEASNVGVNESTLIDPYYRSGVKGYSTIGMQGTMPGFDFPIVETGAIDGTVVRDKSGKPVSGMNLQLVKEDGTVYMTAESAYDGYYAFEFVRPGTYTVRADPKYKVNVPAETVTVSSEELFAYGVDLYLVEPAAEENAAEQADGESGGIAQTYHAPAVSGTSQPAPASPQDGGSSPVLEEPSDEGGTSIEESPHDQGSSRVIEDTSSGGAPSIVKDVRIGEHPDMVRLVMDVSGPTSYKIEEGEGLVIIVDMPFATWNAAFSKTFKYNMVMKGYTTEPLQIEGDPLESTDGGTRLILKARDHMRVKDQKFLPAKGKQSARLYIDFERK